MSPGPITDKAGQPTRSAARRARITDLVVSNRTFGIQDLADDLGVSLMTVHRDLDELQRQGVLQKLRGRATAQPTGVFEPSAAYRATVNVEAKRQIARHACRHVEPGMSILLDDSTTVALMLDHLPGLTPLTVATTYLPGLVELAQIPDVDVVSLAGHYDARHSSFVGAACVESLHTMRFDVAFVSTSAAREGFAFHQEDHIVAVKRAMLQVAGRSHLLIDHTKLVRQALHRLAPLRDFASVIIDGGVPDEQLTELREHAHVEVAGTAES